jgi:hypothetical protein
MADRRRIAAALEYLGAMRDRAAEFGSGVAGTLANRARDVGGLAYEAFTSDPNIGRMNTAEFAQAAASRAPTPRLDAAGQGAVELGRAVLTQPVQTGKALVQGEVDRARQAMTSPRAAGEYAGSMVDPLRLASALRRGPMQELDVYHGTPHRFEPTEANPLGELDASKIGSGEGAQAYGHGIYLAENPRVAGGYRNVLSDTLEVTGNAEPLEKRLAQMALNFGDNTPEGAIKFLNKYEAKGANHTIPAMTPELVKSVKQKFENGTFKRGGFLYTLDLPDEMIDRMLDWDKPISQQSKAVQGALKFEVVKDPDFSQGLSDSKWLLKLNNEVINGFDTRKEAIMSANESTAGQIFNTMNQVKSPSRVADFYKNAGIPGIRYLDAGSRGDTDVRTRNFVVFPGEEKKVKVLRRE